MKDKGFYVLLIILTLIGMFLAWYFVYSTMPKPCGDNNNDTMTACAE